MKRILKPVRGIKRVIATQCYAHRFVSKHPQDDIDFVHIVEPGEEKTWSQSLLVDRKGKIVDAVHGQLTLYMKGITALCHTPTNEDSEAEIESGEADIKSEDSDGTESQDSEIQKKNTESNLVVPVLGFALLIGLVYCCINNNNSSKHKK